MQDKRTEKLKFKIISLNGEVFPVNKMQFSKNNCRVLHFDTSNEQSGSETGTDWLSTFPHVSFQAYERPHHITPHVSSFLTACKVSFGIRCPDLHLLLKK